MTSTIDAVVIGHGPVGQTATAALLARGLRVRVITRSGSGPHDADRAAVDVLDPTATARAIGDVPLVVMASHAPYRATVWAEVLAPMERNVLSHARHSGAVVALPESLYAFDADAGPINARTALRPRSRKGEVRRQLLIQRESSGARVRSVAAGDFVGPGVRGSIAGDFLIPRLLKGSTIRALGNPDLPHAYTYVPDLVAALIAAAELPDEGHQLLMAPNAGSLTHRELATGLAGAAGLPAPEVTRLPNWLTTMAGWFNGDLRELKEIRYQVETPFEVDTRADETRMGLTPTPWSTVFEETVAWWSRARDLQR